MMSKLSLNRPRGGILAHQDRKRLDKCGRTWRLCSLCSSILMAECIMNSCNELKRSIRSTTYKFNAVCVKQSQKNARICGKAIHGFCTTIMHLLTLHCLFVNFGQKQYCNIPQPPYSPDIAPCDFFLFPKIKRTLKGRRFTAIDDIKSASLKELKAIPKIDFNKCFEDWKKRWH